MSTTKITIIFIILIGMLLAVFVPYQNPEWGRIDLLPYWSASKTMLSGGNPYDPNDLYSQQSAIRSDLKRISDVDPAWGPPWTLLLLSPLTWLDFEIAYRLWIFLNVIFVALALYLLWDMSFKPPDGKGLILTFGVGFLFGNTIRLIELGQYTSIMLIALVLYIWLIDREHYVLAGAALLFLMIKPQLTYLAIAVIIIWAFRNRNWKVFVGFIGSGLSLLVLLWLVFPNWLSEYFHLIISIPNFRIYYTTLGSFAESIFGFSALKYIGLLLIPLAYPLSKYVGRAGRLTTLNLALLISIPLAPYGFAFDHILLLPAVVQLVSWIWNKELPVSFTWGIGIAIVISYGLVYFLMNFQSGLPYYWLVFPTIGLAIIYLLAWMKKTSVMMKS